MVPDVQKSLVIEKIDEWLPYIHKPQLPQIHCTLQAMRMKYIYKDISQGEIQRDLKTIEEIGELFWLLWADGEGRDF